MFKLPIRTWILNAAAVFSGQHGAVSQQAEQAGCSRETVYEHASKLEQRLAAAPAAEAVARLQAENQRLREVIAARPPMAAAHLAPQVEEFRSGSARR